jgi:hypothetical protein
MTQAGGTARPPLAHGPCVNRSSYACTQANLRRSTSTTALVKRKVKTMVWREANCARRRLFKPPR